MSPHLIELSNITVEYKTPGHPPKRVLDKLNLTIEAGELLTVCGQTGCGKSTMLRLILGAELPTGGQVLIEGHESRRPDRNRGYVPQKYSLFPIRQCWAISSSGPKWKSSVSSAGCVPASIRAGKN